MTIIKKLAITSICAVLSLCSVAPTSRGIERYQGHTTGRHIVTLREGVSRRNVLSVAKGSASQTITELDIINGFSGRFDDETLTKLRSHPDVTLVAEDGIMYAMGKVTQTDAPWGIARLSSTTRLSGPITALNYTFTYDSSAGGCADIYVVDTGIYIDHTDFGGRARWGGTFGNYSNSDGNGHGTHCAGTAVGTRYGVAKKATVYAVKVLSDAGSGSIAEIIKGLNWVLTNSRATGRPAVISMSLGGGVSVALDNAVATLTEAGVHVVVAAGSSNTDSSPGRAPSAVTVGATTIEDTRVYTSNYGNVVDIYAPGQSITSTWISSPDATNTFSGTSMATPHVAGLVAYLICLEGNVSPAAMSTKLQTYAIRIGGQLEVGFLLAHMPQVS